MADEIATADPSTTAKTETLDKVVVRFAGDSGDGMQVAGSRFTDASALFGNDLATLPSFPAEIRAPAGTLPGVSSFQVQIADFDILTAGDEPDCLVAMNPAALKKNLKDLRQGGTLVINTDAFDERNLAKAGYQSDPLEDGSLEGYRLIKVPMDELTKEAVKDTGVSGRSVLRSKNFFALGLLAWLFHRPTEPTVEWARKKFARTPEVAEANVAAFQAGYTFGEATEAAKITFEIKPAALEPGTYTNVNGNTALAWGLIAASQLSGLPLFYGTYPITPASDILHELQVLQGGGEVVEIEHLAHRGVGPHRAHPGGGAGELSVVGHRGPDQLELAEEEGGKGQFHLGPAGRAADGDATPLPGGSHRLTHRGRADILDDDVGAPQLPHLLPELAGRVEATDCPSLYRPVDLVL